MKVDGYNENLKGYGYDDCELYARLESVAGLTRTYLDYNKIAIYHNPHEDYLRSQHYECKNIALTHYRNRNFYSKKKL
jgi:predicted glycosyltransferase involved in capsule biosynthesis